MGGINGISPIYGGLNLGQLSGPSGMSDGAAIAAGQPGEMGGASSILSLSSTAMSASSQTLLSASSPMLASNEAIGAALLLLVLQYLQSSGGGQEKQDLANMIVALAGMQQQNQGGGDLLLYSSSSMTMESTQLTIATGPGIEAYAGSAASLQQVPQGDAGAASLDVMV